MNDRCFGCPGPEVSDIRPGRAAGRTTRGRATVLSANSTRRRRNCCPSRPHAIRAGPAGRSAPGIAYLAVRTMVNGGFRQLPVADGTGRTGILDIADVCSTLRRPPAA